MLKKRIIPIMLLMKDRLVKTVRFDTWRDVGDPVKSASVYNSQYTDELVFLDIDRENRTIDRLVKLIEGVSEVSFMPLTVGGGIRSFEDAAFLISNGADKIMINSICYENPELITQISEKFGAQAVVVGVDVRKNEATGDYKLYSHCGRKEEALTIEHHLKRCEKFGAGEFMIQSIEHDGVMEGFDIELLKRISEITSIPVIGCSGSGNYNHLKDAFLETDVSALGCGSLFNFSDSNPIRAKNFLTNHNIAFKVV